MSIAKSRSHSIELDWRIMETKNYCIVYTFRIYSYLG